jgi:hypothetical protein
MRRAEEKSEEKKRGEMCAAHGADWAHEQGASKVGLRSPYND